jgi:hypothetical protein
VLELDSSPTPESPVCIHRLFDTHANTSITASYQQRGLTWLRRVGFWHSLTGPSSPEVISSVGFLPFSNPHCRMTLDILLSRLIKKQQLYLLRLIRLIRLIRSVPPTDAIYVSRLRFTFKRTTVIASQGFSTSPLRPSRSSNIALQVSSGRIIANRSQFVHSHSTVR